MAFPPQTQIGITPVSDSRFAVRRANEQQNAAREVDEAVRQDDLAGFMRRWGLPIAAAVLIVLLALAGYLWWRHDQASGAGKRGEALALALDQGQAGRFDASDKALQPLARDPATGIGATAQMMRGAIAQERGKGGDAAKLFAGIVADSSAPKAMRDLAIIRETAAQFDSLPPQQVIDRLKPLAVPGDPWFGNAGELVGMAYLSQGRRDLAGPLFASIARDEQAPDTLRRRARQLAGLLGVDSIDDVAKAIGGEGTEAGAAAQ